MYGMVDARNTIPSQSHDSPEAAGALFLRQSYRPIPQSFPETTRLLEADNNEFLILEEVRGLFIIYYTPLSAMLVIKFIHHGLRRFDNVNTTRGIRMTANGDRIIFDR